LFMLGREFRKNDLENQNVRAEFDLTDTLLNNGDCQITLELLCIKGFQTCH